MWLRAALFSILINAPALIEYLIHGGQSIHIFSDWDEVFYYPQFQAAGHRFLAQIQEGNWDFWWLISPIPHQAIGTLVSAVVDVLGIQLSTFAFVCDLIFAALCYVIFAKAFIIIAKDQLLAELGSFVTLVFPWLLFLSHYFTIPIPFAPDVVTQAHSLYPCQPMMRGISTQISYPIFGLALYYLFSALDQSNSRNSLKKFSISGALAGLSSYLYFFAWPSLIAFGSVLVLLQGERRLRQILVFILSSIVTSSISLLGLLTTISHFSSPSSGDSGFFQRQDFWFFSLEMALFAVLAIYLSKKRPSSKLLWSSVSASVVSTLGLMNTQAIFKAWTVPYHYPLFYLDPILSGCAVMGILCAFQIRRIRLILAALLVLAATASPLNRIYYNFRNHSANLEIAELVDAIESLTHHNAKLLLMPWADVFQKGVDISGVLTLPYAISTLTHRSLYVNPMGESPDALLNRELMIGWIYSGKIQLVAACPDKPPALPGDMLRGVNTHDFFRRYVFCEKNKSKIIESKLCDIINSSAPEYVVWPYFEFKEIPASSKDVLNSLWKSKDGNFELFEFRNEHAIATYCSDTAK